jgi:hypothetical protein
VEIEAADAPGGTPRWRFRVLRDATLLASGEVVAESLGAVAANEPAAIGAAS